MTLPLEISKQIAYSSKNSVDAIMQAYSHEEFYDSKCDSSSEESIITFTDKSKLIITPTTFEGK